MTIKAPFLHKKKKNTEKTQLVKELPMSGFGHIIVPSDIDRDEYVRIVFKSGQCMVLDHYGTIFRNVLIPKNQLDLLHFPQSTNELGSLVGWLRTSQMNAVAITNVYFDGKELSNSGENRSVAKKGSGNTQITISETTRQNPIRTVTVRGNNEGDTPGGHEIHTQGSSGKSTQVLQDLDGNIKFRADKDIDMNALEKVEIKIGKDDEEYGIFTITHEGTFSYTDRHGATVTIDEDQVLIDHESLIEIGSNTEAAVKGDSLVSWLEDLISAINTITVTTSNGPSGTPINFLQFEALSAQLETLKSQLFKFE